MYKTGCIKDGGKRKILKGFPKEIIELSEEQPKPAMKDRFMGENTRLLYDLMHYLEENNMDGLLLLVDFEKAFDSIEWNGNFYRKL